MLIDKSLMMTHDRSSSLFSETRLSLAACRFVTAISMLGFLSFALCDRWMTDSAEQLWSLYVCRACIIAGCTVVLSATFTELGRRHISWLSMAIVVWTGFGVVLATELTGGASSIYWTMIMLTYFGASLIIPFKVWQAGVSFLTVAMFYVFWMIWNDATGTMMDWLSSNTGIWLSLVASMLAVGFLSHVRKHNELHHSELERLNEELRLEIADRELAQEAFNRSQKLDAVGRLASGLAHELNNVLMVITGTAECIEFSPDDAIPFANQIVESAQRGARMTSALLQFSRQGSREDVLLDMRTVVRQVNEILQRSQRGRIELDLKDEQQPCWVAGDAQLLSQALLNLTLNAIDAMDGTGKLVLEIKRTWQTIDVEVSDTGCGMTEEELAKSCEPFFTTKPPGAGTGLGLSMAYGTVTDHDGELILESKIGLGTTAIMRLPREYPKQTLVEPGEGEKYLARISATALLIDDDDMVRVAMKACLENLGIRVVEASGGHEAIEKFSTAEQAYDLVVVDLVMPIMDGRETFHDIRELNPEQSILIYSGFAENDSVLEMLQCGNCRFLRKPFRVRELSDAIEKTVSQCSSRSASAGT